LIIGAKRAVLAFVPLIAEERGTLDPAAALYLNHMTEKELVKMANVKPSRLPGCASDD